MSNLRYDPVHDVGSPASVSTVTESPSKTESAAEPVPESLAPVSVDPAEQSVEKVSISSLLSQDNSAEKEPKLSKRVIQANKRKQKDLNHSEPLAQAVQLSQLPLHGSSDVFKAEIPNVKRRKKELKEPNDANPIHRSKHLKKPDSEPLLRLDIQHDFLQKLLTNNLKLFKNPFGKIDESVKYWPKIADSEKSLGYEGKLTFFQLYLLTILKSNRISKILKDRLVGDLNYAFKFIILCLLVNFGRLNTTINFDYEMRSQLRTYHCIPVLQIHHDIFDIAPEPEDVVENNGGGSGYTLNSVKQLQDTPRLKTILKSVNDFNSDLNNENYEAFIQSCKETYLIPEDHLTKRFNLVSLIFSLSHYEEQVMEQFFEGRRYDDDKKSTVFNEVFNVNTIKPENKVARFLWLIYLLSETDMSPEGNLDNPFGEIVDGVNRVLALQMAEDNVEYNVDTPEEMAFAEDMKLKRRNFLEIVENLSEGETISKDGKIKLNKKGRKKRVIKESAAQGKKVVTIAIKPEPHPVKKEKEPKLSPEDRIKNQLLNNFILESVQVSLKKIHEEREKLGNLEFLSLRKSDLLSKLHISSNDKSSSSLSIDEFRLSYSNALLKLETAHKPSQILDDLF